MKKMMISALASAMVFVIASCSGGSGAAGNTPSTMVEKYSEATIKGDYKQAIDLIHFQGTADEVKEKKQMYTQLIEEKVKEGLPDNKKPTNIEILNEEVNEEEGTAVVTTSVTYADGKTKEEKLQLVKEDGKWLIDEKK